MSDFQELEAGKLDIVEIFEWAGSCVGLAAKDIPEAHCCVPCGASGGDSLWNWRKVGWLSLTGRKVPQLLHETMLCSGGRQEVQLGCSPLSHTWHVSQSHSLRVSFPYGLICLGNSIMGPGCGMRSCQSPTELPPSHLGDCAQVLHSESL